MRVFRVSRSIRHVDLSHAGKTGSDCVTSAYLKICGYDRPRESEVAVYSKISFLGVDFHIPDQNGGRQKNHCYSETILIGPC